MSFPNDETGNVLTEMQQAGLDLSQSVEVTFFQLFEEKSNAIAMQQFVEQSDMQATVSLHPDQTPNVWDVDCTLTMVPSYDNIVEFEEKFENIARQFDGYNDGWGVEAD